MRSSSSICLASLGNASNTSSSGVENTKLSLQLVPSPLPSPLEKVKGGGRGKLASVLRSPEPSVVPLARCVVAVARDVRASIVTYSAKSNVASELYTLLLVTVVLLLLLPPLPFPPVGRLWEDPPSCHDWLRVGVGMPGRRSGRGSSTVSRTTGLR